MPFTDKPQVFNTSIHTTVIGDGDNAVTLGGENILPLYFFDQPVKNPPL
jgi:acetyl-CoA decarbonylase/synthase complex subunit delta